MRKMKLIIDCDPGTDDAHAIFIALAQPHVELLAVTTVHGNSTVSNCTRNTCRTLKAADRTDVPVYEGCATSLLGETLGCIFHGEDGMGDTVVDGVDPVEMEQVQKDHASVAIGRIAQAHKGEVTLVTLGPLTNIAIALQLDPNLAANLKAVVIMGGSSDGRGNATPTAEFNFHQDPEAAEMVLKCLHRHGSRKPRLIPLELCKSSYSDWSFYDETMAIPTPKGKFISRVTTKKTQWTRNHGDPGHYMYDEIAIAAALDDTVVMETNDYYCTVELQGMYCRGMVVVDRNKKLGRESNVTIVHRVNFATVQTLWKGCLGAVQ